MYAGEPGDVGQAHSGGQLEQCRQGDEQREFGSAALYVRNREEPP